MHIGFECAYLYMWFSVRLDMGKKCWLQVLNGRHNIVSMEGKVGGKKGSREGGRERYKYINTCRTLYTIGIKVQSW